MTSEHLLEAMGLLDDDLIDQAERTPVRSPVPWQQWLGLCACLALVIFIGRGAVQNWGRGSSSASAGSSASTGGSSPSGSAGGAGASSGTAAQPDGTEPQDGEIYILVDSQSYLSTGETVPELPAGAEELGVLSAAEDGAPSPSTNGAEYVGCLLYAGADGRLYAELPQGGYDVFELAEPGP